MTLTIETDLDMVKMYDHTKNEVSVATAFKSYSPDRYAERTEQTDRHTLTTKTLPLLHTREVTN